MKYLVKYILFALCCLSTVQAQTPMASSDAFAAQLRGQSAAIETIDCAFTQVKHMEALANDVTSTGRFYYRRNVGICLRFDKPAGDEIVMGSEKFRIVTAGRRSVVAMNANPALRQMKNMLTACMTGDIALLEEGAETSYFDAGKSYRVEIVPGNKRARTYVNRMVLTFDKRDMSLSKLRMEEPSGNYTEYTFTDKTFNGPVDAVLFDVD